MRTSGLSAGQVTAAGVAVLLAILAVISGIAWTIAGDEPDHRRAIAFAAAVVGASGVAGWLVSRLGRGAGATAGLAGGLGPTLVRLGPMLAALAWVTTEEGVLREAGAAGWLVAFYLPMLLADIGLTLLARPGGPWDGGGETAN